MTLKPVQHYSEPRYPKKEVFTEHPELFEKWLPARWGISGISVGALASALLTCSHSNAPQTEGQKQTIEFKATDNHEILLDPDTSRQSTASETFFVAPLFLHGDGIGSTGCIMMTPPVFLNESEAYGIIVKVLNDHGIKITKSDTLIESAKMAEHHITSSNQHCYDSIVNVPFTLSGFNDELKTGFEFISFSKAAQLQDGGCECNYDSTMVQCMSFSSHNLKETAVEAANELRHIGGMHAGVFYDPCADTREESISLLQAQVLDFVKFLQNKEIIPSTKVLKR